MCSDVDGDREAERDDVDREPDAIDSAPETDRADVPVDSGSGPTPCAYTEYVRGADPGDLPATGADAEGLERAVWDALSDVEDPEMPVSVVDLGLIYGVELEERGADDPPAETHVTVIMTLTYTGCPARNMLTDDVREAAASPEGVDEADVRLVWSPEWSLEMVTEQGRADLREFGLSV